MKKILVMLTGGTIGSKSGGEDINVDSSAAYNLIALYTKEYGSDVCFEVIQPLNILSENITLNKWTNLCKPINDVDFNKYDGMIITHGSDTLAYTSALVGMIYGSASIPIVIVAANYALDDVRSNGLRNFRGAVSFIKESITNGVFTIYEDENGIMQVYISTRIIEADCYKDQLTSFGGDSFGVMQEDKLILNKSDINPSLKEINNISGDSLNNSLEFTNNVLFIHGCPGLNYDYYKWNENNKPSAVLIQLYHSATICTSEADGAEYSFATFAKRCLNDGIDVYAVSFKSADTKLYSSSKEFLDAGVTPVFNMSATAAYMKLVILYNESIEDKTLQEEIEAKLNKNIFFEALPQKNYD